MQYLGMLQKRGRMQSTAWQLVIEKVERRLKGWQAKLLSRGEGLVLVAIQNSLSQCLSWQ